jgi:predicted Zn finger-like uncharacterized protein
MPIRFQCRNCDTRIRVPDGTEGKKVRCPRCSETQPVPGAKINSGDTGDVIRLDEDPINRPKSGPERDPEYVPKHMRQSAPPADAVKPGAPDPPESPEPPEAPATDAADSDGPLVLASDGDRRATGKPLGDSVADRAEEAHNVAAEDSHSSRDGTGEPLLEMDSDPTAADLGADELTSSGELLIEGQISRADSIGIDQAELSESRQEASSVHADVREADEALPVSEAQSPAGESLRRAATEATAQAPPARPKRVISLSDSRADHKESRQSMDEAEPIIEPEDSGAFGVSGGGGVSRHGGSSTGGSGGSDQAGRVRSSRQPRSPQRAAERSPASAGFGSPSRSMPAGSSAKPPALMGLLIVAYMMRAFAVIMFIWALLSAFTLLPAAMGMMKHTRMGYILGFMGLALLFWCVGEIAAAVRLIARKPS